MNFWQGFGKRKNTVGMARPKKTKVAAREEVHTAVSDAITAAGERVDADGEHEEPSGREKPGGARLRQAVGSCLTCI